ncbi:MAG TPA: dTDP-4-dehydrorhamnose 3,5-epimerase [Caulobacteraceae bacterium]|jgi:dTDP-4-dehydrorhamnose 3,5-epimerase
MQVESLAITQVLLITPRRFGDDRGWFSEAYKARELAAAGVNDAFLQDNQAYSAQRGTLRGLHLQVPPEPISKLVRCLKGAIFDVAVDVRAGSPTFGRWVGAELTADNGRQLYCPRGFAHAYVTLQPDTEVFYKCDGYYAPACERGIRWNDPAIGIDWPIDEADIVINDRDRALPLLTDFEPVRL